MRNSVPPRRDFWPWTLSPGLADMGDGAEIVSSAGRNRGREHRWTRREFPPAPASGRGRQMEWQSILFASLRNHPGDKREDEENPKHGFAQTGANGTGGSAESDGPGSQGDGEKDKMQF